MKEVIFIDGLNTFIRSYVVLPALDPKGRPIGGCMGFLKSLQKMVRTFQPDEVVICWDGQGGSQRRRAQNKDYKQGRAPLRFNRRMYEADDLVALLCRSKHYEGWKKTIISSDKDFYQLADDETSIYRPIQDKMVTTETLVEEFGIHPNNFALARAIAGDPSDNIKGIGRVGLGTIKKRLEFMREPEDQTVQSLVEHCQKVEKKLSCHNKIIDKRDVIHQNYLIMQLYSPKISPINREKLLYNVQHHEPEVNISTIKMMMITDGFGAYRFDDLFGAFRRLCSYL
jgi:DNA polymerase-1